VRTLPGGAGAARRLAGRYVAGTTVEDALACAHELAARGIASAVDLFGENVTDAAQADRVADAYVELAGQLARFPAGTNLAIDLSHIGLDESARAVRRRLARIAGALAPGARIDVGAEQEARAQPILDAVIAVAGEGLPVGATVQANLRRAPADARALGAAGVAVRLVKGAYVESPQVALRWGDETDLAFVSLAHQLRADGAPLALATHDAVLRESLLAALPGVGVEMLLGVRGADAAALAARGVPTRVYVPYGDAWFRYAMRRIAESAQHWAAF